jgi:alkylation response protein AidB-like acyl-CoA dehydrogenase
MDFAWSETDCELYERATTFARSLRGAGTEGEPFPLEEWRRCGEFGLLGLSVPEALGGGGFGALTTARVIEAFGRACTNGGLLFSAAAHLFACTMPIVEYADAELKRTLSPKLSRGELIGANAITEAEAGSDVAALKTTATRGGDHYVLNGAKSYVTNGPVADVFLVYAATAATRGFFGLTAFAVDKNTPGLVVGRPFRKVGLHAAPTGQVYFENCRVPASRRLGEEGQGMAIFQASMAWERGCLFAAYLGAMDRDLATAISFARERQQFGRPIGKNQAVAHRIADMKLRLESARWLLYHSCWLKDRGQDSTLDISLAKLAVSEAAVQSGLDLIRIHGSLGISSESRLADSLFNALPSTTFSGTSEIQRDLISRSLGL